MLIKIAKLCSILVKNIEIFNLENTKGVNKINRIFNLKIVIGFKLY